MSDWRDRLVFDLAENEIKRVEVTYPAENMNLNSFVFKKDGDKISVEADPGGISNYQLNERRAKVYATFFQDVQAEGFTNGLMGIDTTIASVPKFCAIDITSTAGKQQHLDVYWMPMNKRSKNMLTPDPETPSAYDADRMYAVTNNFKD